MGKVSFDIHNITFTHVMNYSFLICILSLCLTLAFCGQKTESELAIDNYKRYYLEARKTRCPEKEAAIVSFRRKMAGQSQRPGKGGQEAIREILLLLNPDGTFSDLDENDVGVSHTGNAADNGGTVTEAFNRLWRLSEAFRNGTLSWTGDLETWKRCQKAIIHYGKIEISRPNISSRFHASCSAIPTAAVYIYFCHLPQMDRVEQGKTKDKRLRTACDMLKTVALQAWTQPLRGDATDGNVIQLERFRNHSWWEGGNALAYRPLLQVAYMFRSIPMIDMLADICSRSIGITSQHTCHDSFWDEGLTADGAGWGHGKQCLVWGYPLDGTMGALNMMRQLQGSPWERKLTPENVSALMNFFRGGNFYYYKGYILPCLDRNSMAYIPDKSAIPYQKILKSLLTYWRDSFSKAELNELGALYRESSDYDIRMEKYEVYNGTRWFFNNDNLIKKNADYHIMVSMSSVRCDGIESAADFADGYNFYTTDGMTLFQKSGNEYRPIWGGADVTAMPGITAREGMEQLEAVTNWRGYCSEHNFAAAATTGGANAAAGFIFEKMNASDKEGVNDRGDNDGKNALLYGVKAYKSYFMLEDYMVALGSGITNLDPGQPGRIRTTIDQTAHTGKVYSYAGKGIEWIIQEDKFAYSVLPEYRSRMHYVCETKPADWVKMNPSNRTRNDLPQEVKIFRMWLDHGRNPVNDSYGYVVYAGKGMPADEYPFRVLNNDKSVQAVASAGNQVVGAVFYDPNREVHAGDLSLSVSDPCAVLIEKLPDGMCRIAVTDALMDKECTSIRVALNGQIITCEMPQGEWCGKPAIVDAYPVGIGRIERRDPTAGARKRLFHAFF